MPLVVETTDKKIIEIKDSYIKYSSLLSNIQKLCSKTDTLPLLISSKTMETVLSIMEMNQPLLPEQYDHDEIIFEPGHKKYLLTLQPDDVIEVCNAANYLGYMYLLELSSFVIAEFMQDKEINEMGDLFGGTQMDDEERKRAFREFEWLPKHKED